jgi:nucleotidyltransferase/DNA polymerase involved in DNA repair
MDAFFAAVEQRDNPAFIGKPVIVGVDPKEGFGRGVVSTCSYEARKFGVRSAMPIYQAHQLCPQGVFVKVDMEKYVQESRRIHTILNEFTPIVEMTGLDEGFLDITSSFHLFGSPADLCLKLKKRIKKETGLTASVGLAPTRMAAKVASDLKKPDGFVEVKAEDFFNFLKPLDIGKVYGVGKKSREVLLSYGIKTISDVFDRGEKKMRELLGKNGGTLWQLVNGIDDDTLVIDREAKSISNEDTFPEDISDEKQILAIIMRLSEKVSGRLRHEGLSGKTITLKIRLAGFETYTRAVTLSEPTNLSDTIFKEIKKLYNSLGFKGKKIRLIGVKVSNFTSGHQEQMDLFKPDSGKKESIQKAMDKIKGKFGDGAIVRAQGMEM